MSTVFETRAPSTAKERGVKGIYFVSGNWLIEKSVNVNSETCVSKESEDVVRDEY